MNRIIVLLSVFIPTLCFAIVDGEVINPGDFRQSVALVFKKDPSQTKGEIYCSGTLIGPRVVATVAHCFLSGAKSFKVSLENFQKQTWVYLGETENSSDLPMIIPQYKNARVILHPQSDSIYSDLALVELSEDVDLAKEEIVPAGLFLPTKELVGNELIHVGFGQMSNSGIKGNKKLLRLPLQQLTGYNGLGVGEMYVRGPGACHGDSGGSAYMADRSGVLKFVGIEYGLSNHPCGESATYFIPLTPRIIDWMKSLGRPLFI